MGNTLTATPIPAPPRPKQKKTKQEYFTPSILGQPTGSWLVALHRAGCCCSLPAGKRADASSFLAGPPTTTTPVLQSALAKERRELREQQNRMLLEAIPKDLSKPWEDPLAGGWVVVQAASL